MERKEGVVNLIRGTAPAASSTHCKKKTGNSHSVQSDEGNSPTSTWWRPSVSPYWYQFSNTTHTKKIIGVKYLTLETEKISPLVAYCQCSYPLPTAVQNLQLPVNCSTRRHVTLVVVGLWRNNTSTLWCECQYNTACECSVSVNGWSSSDVEKPGQTHIELQYACFSDDR